MQIPGLVCFEFIFVIFEELDVILFNCMPLLSIYSFSLIIRFSFVFNVRTFVIEIENSIFVHMYFYC